MLEPYEGKLSRTVLRGLETGNGLRLLDEGLKKLGYKRNPNELMKHADTLELYFKQNPPRSIGDAQDSIQRLTGIKRSPTQIRISMVFCASFHSITIRKKTIQCACCT